MSGLVVATDVCEWNSTKNRVLNLDVKPQENFYNDLALRPLANRDKPQTGALFSTAAFDTKVAGSGTAGTAPFDNELLEACGMIGVNSPGTSEVYTVSPTLSFTAVDIDVYKANAYLISCNNACGNALWTFAPNMPVIASWDLGGSYTAPSDASGTASLGTTALAPICKGLTANITGTQSATLHLTSMIVNLNNTTTSPDEDIAGTNGIQNPQLTDNNPTFTWTARLGAVATSDWFTDLTTGVKMTFNAVVGSVAGNITTFNMNGFFSEQIEYSENNGKHEITGVCQMSRETGDNQFTISYT